ncbi:MotA/TolQ/ExbB proton channel family protein [candidate division KSB1 bacterium]|nr:MotA/TolQ/ExbB proton channel family protein [candidate division KSB1 bacterium]
MTEFWQSFTPGWSGWAFMWILLLAAAFMIAIVIERSVYIFVKSNINAPRFMAQIRRFIEAGEHKKAISLCGQFEDKALPQIILRGLIKFTKNPKAGFRTIQNAVDEGTLEVIPKLQARTNYLAMIGNVATLIGLMGTIYGLILSFRSVSAPGIDVAEKSRLLAHGIAVAMNTTLFGLAVAIPSIMAYTMIHNKTIQIIDEIDEHTVKLINMIATEDKR